LRWSALALACLLPAGVRADPYHVERLVGGQPAHGLHGLGFDPEGRLYAGSVVGQTIYRVDDDSGELEEFVGPPDGMADDLVFGPGGVLVWTAFLAGELRAKDPEGPVRVLARDLPGLNSLAFRKDGRLFVTQVFLGDALWEIDVDGRKPPRRVASDLGGLNGFDFGPDGKLYGPLWFKGQVVRLDVNDGALEVVAQGFRTPAAVNFDSLGNLFVLDHGDGRVWKVDPESGAKRRLTTLAPGFDNLAFDARDRLFLTLIPESAIYEVDPSDGSARRLRSSPLAMPGDLALATGASKPTLLVADLFAQRSVDAASGRVRDLATMGADAIEYPTGVAAGKRFHWWSGWFSGAVVKTDRTSGRILRTWHGFERPMDVVELPGGGALVAEAGGRLLRVPAEEAAERSAVSEDLHGPVAIALLDENHLVVTESESGTLARVDLATGVRQVLVEQLRGPEGVALGPDGRIYLVEVGARRVLSFDADGSGRTVVAENLPLGLPAPAGVPSAFVTSGIAVDSRGVVYVASDLEDAIYRLTPE
jgi:sugar lactone lactonase YvrE